MFKIIERITVVLMLIGLLGGFIFMSQIQAQAPHIYIKNNMRFDEKLNVPVAIYNVDSRQHNGTPEQVARQYLLEHRQLLGMAENLSDLELIEVKNSPAGYHVGFKQVYHNIPVMRSEIVVSMNQQNSITMVINGYKPGISVNTTAAIEKSQALQLAKRAIGAENTAEIFPSQIELMVYQDSIHIFHLVWKAFIFPDEPDGEWLIILDAHNGSILENFNTVFSYVDGTGRLFDPDPVTALRDPNLTDQNDADYAALQPAYDTVTLNDLNNAVGGYYYVQGKYAWSENILDLSGDDEIVKETNPNNFVYNRSQNGFEEVNIYYFLDKQRRYIGTLGFSPTWKYLGSSETIAFDARGTTERNNYYSPFMEYLYFGVPPNYVDGGEDQSAILHEYGHAFHDALLNGGIEGAGFNSDTRGISEGLADYLSISYRRTTQSDPFRPNYRFNWFYPEEGESILNPNNAKYPDPDHGGHWGSSPYEKMKVWASTLMDMEYLNATNPLQGTRLGRDITTKLALTSFNYLSTSSTAEDNVHAIFQADRDIYNGAHLQILADIFDNRGFFYYNKVSGAITSYTSWSGYKLVTGDVTVNSGATLEITSGTIIFFESGIQLIVNGTLTTRIGESGEGQSAFSDRIIFTSSSLNPQRGDWNWIKFNNTAVNCFLEYCDIEYAKTGIWC